MIKLFFTIGLCLAGSCFANDLLSADDTPELDINNAELVENALYSSLVLQNTPAVEKLLPIYQKNHNKSDKTARLLIHMSEALLAEQRQAYKTSIRLYREVLAEYPAMLDVRMRLAEILFFDQQNEAAKDQLLRLRSENSLTDSDKIGLDKYIQAINQRTTWEVSGGAGLICDPNINNAPKQTSIDMNGGTWTLPEAESAKGVSYRVNLNKSLNLKNNYYGEFQSSLSGKSYWSSDDYDDINAKIGLGVSYKDTNTELSLIPYYQRRWAGGDIYTKETGIVLDWSHWLSNRHQLVLSSKAGKESYYGRLKNYNTGNLAEITGTYVFVNNARQYWTAGLGYSQKDSKDDSRAYHRNTLYGSWTQDWQKGLSTNVSLAISKSTYKAADIVGITRKDTEYNTNLSVWHRNVHFAGITPRLSFVHHRNDSNHPFYDVNKSNVFIQFNKKF